MGCAITTALNKWGVFVQTLFVFIHAWMDCLSFVVKVIIVCEEVKVKQKKQDQKKMRKNCLKQQPVIDCKRYNDSSGVLNQGT